MGRIIMGIMEGRIVRESQVPISYTLGSYVGICPYDRRECITGMARIIFLEGKYSIHWGNVYKSTDEDIHELIGRMREQGARSVGLIARTARSTRMSGTSFEMLDIGQQNVVAVRGCLAQEGIRLVTRHTGQNYDRTILFYTENGRLKANTVRHSAVVL